MFGFRIDEEFLDLDANTSFSFEVNNPLFNTDFEKGMHTYDVSAPASDRNRRLLQHAGSLSIRSFGNRALPCQMWLKGQLYRAGKLYVLERTEKYKLQFVSDAGDLDTVADDKLRLLDLTGVGVSYPRVNNSIFSDSHSYMNAGGATVPMPNLVQTFRNVLANYGYSVSGSWLADYADRVIYNPVQASGTVDITRHVPDLEVAEFLKRIRKHYGLAFLFNTKARQLQLVYLQDALSNPNYTDWTHLIANRVPFWEPNTTDGFTLQLATENDDALQEGMEGAWQYRIGNGKQGIPTGIGTTSMQGGVPTVLQEGSTYADEADFAFRVLAGSVAETVAGVASRHTDWLAWKSEAENITFSTRLGIAELLHLDPLDKKLIRTPQGTFKAFWEKVEIDLNMRGEMQSKVRFLKVMQ